MQKSIIVGGILLAGVALLAAYVYRSSPFVIWVLLGVCWGCFRLGRRAERLFGKTTNRAGEKLRNSSDLRES
jgi:small neutral amino acid transporter SnatA (MarC family)